MKYAIFTVFDRLAEEYSTPFFQKNIRLGWKAFQNFFEDGRNDPKDYALFHVGHYDTESGRITDLEDGHSPILINESFMESYN